PEVSLLIKSKYALEMVKTYSLDQCDVVDIPMVGESKLDEDPNGTLVDPTRYRGMVGSLMYLTASRLDLVFAVYVDHASCQDSRRSTSRSAQFLEEKLLIDYGFHFNKIPLNSDSKRVIALSCKTVQHSRTKHIAVRYHFIKEQVENEVVELNFVKTDYQLADIFTKALARECFEFLINRLGMQSITLKELERLTESEIYNNPVPKEKEIVRFSAVILNNENRMQEMFPDKNDYHLSSPPATKTSYPITYPQPNSLQAKAKKLMQNAKKNMRKINFKKAVAQKFREYDQKLEALTNFNVLKHLKKLSKQKF
ncbi:hypothetical protein Tco_0305168, partial [Tanacetum coccineum]